MLVISEVSNHSDDETLGMRWEGHQPSDGVVLATSTHLHTRLEYEEPPRI